MSNVSIVNDEYNNIQGVAVKKIKVTRPNLNVLLSEGEKSRIQVKEEVQKDLVVDSQLEKSKVNVVNEVKLEEEKPMYLHDREPVIKDYSIDEEALKERVAENYKNLANFDKKLEKKTESVQKLDLDEKTNKIKKLLSSNVTIMTDKKEMIAKVFDTKLKSLEEAKAKKAEFADDFRKVSDEEQVAKNNKKTIEDRFRLMNDKKNFLYLTIGEGEDNEIVDAISGTNESLKHLYNVCQKHLKFANATIDECEMKKKDINRASEEAGLDIAKAIDELNKFIDEAIVILENIIKVNKEYEEAQNKSESITNEYNAIAEKEKANVGINLNIPEETNQNVSQPQNSIPNLNIFENFRRAASEGGDEAAVNLDNGFINNYESETVGFGRTV